MDNIFVNYFISMFVEALSRNTWSVHVIHTLVSSFSNKRSSPAIIDHDIHKLLVYYSAY